MSTDVFELYIQQSLHKLENLWQRNSLLTQVNEQPEQNQESVSSEQQLIQDSLTELSASIEELQVATETLREQNAELLAGRQKLERERSYYQELFDTAPDCYLVTSSSGTIKEVNQKTAELLGVSAQYLKNKALAVFVAAGQKTDYYTQLNRLRKGEISELVWDLELISRQQELIKVSCSVAAMGDRLGKTDNQNSPNNLRWYFFPLIPEPALSNSASSKSLGQNRADQKNQTKIAKPQPDSPDQAAINLTQTLISGLRYSIYDLDTQIQEIYTQPQFDSSLSQNLELYPLEQISHGVYEMQQLINNAYIIDGFQTGQDLKLYLVDYKVFIEQTIRTIQRHNNFQQEILFRSNNNYSGICDIFLLSQILINLLGICSHYGSAETPLQISLDSSLDRSVVKLTIQISLTAAQAKAAELREILAVLGSQTTVINPLRSLELAVISKCLKLLDGTLKAKQKNTVDTAAGMADIKINIKLPLIRDFGK